MRSPNNDRAIKEQAKARKLSAEQFKQQMAFMKQQAEMAGEFEMPDMKPASPPTSASPDVFDAGMEQKRRGARRFGFSKTIMAGELPPPPSLGGFAPLGGGGGGGGSKVTA